MSIRVKLHLMNLVVAAGRHYMTVAAADRWASILLAIVGLILVEWVYRAVLREVRREVLQLIKSEFAQSTNEPDWGQFERAVNAPTIDRGRAH